MKTQVAARWLVIAASLFIATAASAAEVRVMISAGFFHVYSELGPGFERATGHRLVTTRGPSMGDSPEAIPTRLGRGDRRNLLERRCGAVIVHSERLDERGRGFAVHPCVGRLARPGDQPVFVSDISLARSLLGWSPKIGPREGVTRLLAWVSENRELFDTR